MFNLNTKTGIWLAASLLSAASVFGDSHCGTNSCSDACTPKCPEPMQAPTIAAYNAPAGINTQCSWDVFADITFTYWQPILENLEIGMVDYADSTAGSIFNMKFEYKPGFKIAVGVLPNYDDWSVWGEYTWFRGTQTQTASVGTPARMHPIQLPPITIQTQLESFTRKWRLSMDFADLLMGREYYVGKKLTFNSFFGARGAWIRQNLNDTFFNTEATRVNGYSNQSTHSWAVGPKAGLNTKWMIGAGTRFIGNGSVDILYTRYTNLTVDSVCNYPDAVGEESPSISVVTKQKNSGYLRTHLEMEMGLGWGSYFANNKWHFDLAATYGFQVFFNQNMFRQFVDNSTVTIGTSFVPNGDLFVHGLNLTARVDF